MIISLKYLSLSGPNFSSVRTDYLSNANFNFFIDGTIHGKPGAAELFVVFIYSLLTKRQVKGWDWQVDNDFTDRNYQFGLPMHARSTASRAIKNNMKITEFITEPNIITNMEKVSCHFSKLFIEDQALVFPFDESKGTYERTMQLSLKVKYFIEYFS